jgi:hypothetical protein
MRVDIHFVCKKGLHWTQVDQNIYETGNWYVADRTADQVIGGRVYLHDKQNTAAWHGGRVIGWRPVDSTRRKIFTYVLEGDFQVKLLDGWGNEKAVVRKP